MRSFHRSSPPSAFSFSNLLNIHILLHISMPPPLAFLPILPLRNSLKVPSNSLTTRASLTPPSSSSTPSSTQSTPSSTSPTSPTKTLDIVLTHSTADFDSFAAAVGLAKLHSPTTLVVTPSGESPSLRRFLSLHRQLFRTLPFSLVHPPSIRWLGVVDTVRLARLGMASTWPQHATHVEVWDHHIGRVCDIQHPNLTLFVDRVGAVVTLVCEKLRERGISLSAPEATLMALAIHADTGSLTGEQTTKRDVLMLAWLMTQGVVQRSVAEFSHALLSDEQQEVLSRGLREVKRRRVRGVEVGSLAVVGRVFVKGMSIVAADLLEIGNLDVLIVVYVNCRGRKGRKKKKKMDDGDYCGPEELKQVSVIGRAKARVDGVDFREIFKDLGGGGHARAASASAKMTEAEAEVMLDSMMERLVAQIPEPKKVGEMMSTELITVNASTDLDMAKKLMILHGHRILPVVAEDGGLVGLIALQHINVAEAKRGDDAKTLPVGAWMHQNVISVPRDTPFHEAEEMVAESSMGMLCIVDDDGKLVGAVTRMDVLVARRLWPEGVEVKSTPIGYV